MNRYLKTKNTDDCVILIPIDTITEVILYDKTDENPVAEASILIFVKDESTAAGREDYEDVEVARLRFDTIESILNS